MYTVLSRIGKLQVDYDYEYSKLVKNQKWILF